MRFFDLHNDFPTKIDDFAILSGDINVEIIGAVYSGNRTFEEAISIAKKVNAYGKNLYLAFENIGYKDLDLDKIIKLKPKYVSLTYNGENDLGYGCDFDLPLKSYGKSVAKRLCDSGITIDVAHTSQKSAFSVLDITDKVICSHTALNCVHKHKRNLSNELIKEIVNRGGIIGVTLVQAFLGETNVTVYDLYKHIDTFVSQFGINSLSIGTDFYGAKYMAGDIKEYTQFELLKNVLENKGYTDNDIDKIFYQNAKNYFFKE